MATTEINDGSLDDAARTLGDGEIFMVNLLRYNATARYEDGDQPPCSGREAYFTRYVPAFAEVTKGQGIGAQWVGCVHAALVGPADEAWDDVAVVRYPDFAAFRTMIEGADYLAKADPHRRAALADWRLLATTAMPLPGPDAQA
ncbi:MAG: hypothetical protein ABW200_14490 [Hyphomicrobiaceae bacterium]